MRVPALLLVFLAPGKCVAWMLGGFFCVLWQWCVCVAGREVVILRNSVSSSSLFFVAFPISVTQVSSNTEGEKMSITKATGSGSFVEITCDLITQTLRYIHWYKYQEGTAPQRLLYYDISYSKVTLESGVSEGKYKVYKEKSYTFAISNLQESDSGIYYCAAWEKHIGLDCLYTALEILLVTAKPAVIHSIDQPLPYSLPPVLFTLKEEKSWVQCRFPNIYIQLLLTPPLRSCIFPKNRSSPLGLRQAATRQHILLAPLGASGVYFTFSVGQTGHLGLICSWRYLGE